MNNQKNFSDNPLSRRWKTRYENQPDSIKQRLDILRNQNVKDYQLKVIKRKRGYPEKGDVFLINPKDSLYFFGVVVNNNVSNINGNNLLVIMIFRDKAKSLEDNVFRADYTNLLIEPCIVGKEYWVKGLFYNVGNIELNEKIDYGFYSVGKGKYFDEYGKEMLHEPRLLGTYGVSTISGIAYKVNKELIIDENLLL